MFWKKIKIIYAYMKNKKNKTFLKSLLKVYGYVEYKLCSFYQIIELLQ